jgi:hypothetical protein
MISGDYVNVVPAVFAPGAPIVIQNASNSLPIVYSVDSGAIGRLKVSCQDITKTPSTTTIMSFNGQGAIKSQIKSISNITNFPYILPDNGYDFWYTAPVTSVPITESMRFVTDCNGAIEKGFIDVIVLPAVVPDSALSFQCKAGQICQLYLRGTISHPGLMMGRITSLPIYGNLSQHDVYNPNNITLITEANTMVSSPLLRLKYIPMASDILQIDTFEFNLIHGGLVSASVTVTVKVVSWDMPPVIPTVPQKVDILHRQSTSVDLAVDDNQQHQYIGALCKMLRFPSNPITIILVVDFYLPLFFDLN